MYQIKMSFSHSNATTFYIGNQVLSVLVTVKVILISFLGRLVGEIYGRDSGIATFISFVVFSQVPQ